MLASMEKGYQVNRHLRELESTTQIWIKMNQRSKQ